MWGFFALKPQEISRFTGDQTRKWQLSIVQIIPSSGQLIAAGPPPLDSMLEKELVY